MSFVRLVFICGGLLASCKPPVLPSGEIHVRAVRLAASKAKSPGAIAPYDEAVSWHEYEVKSVSAGKLAEKKIRVAHWTVLRGKAVPVDTGIGKTAEMKLRPFEGAASLQDIAQSDDLAITFDHIQRFVDIGQPQVAETTPEAMRFDYAGNASNQMKLYWKLRPQLKIVVMGNSHAAKGVCTGLLGGEENQTTPVALNLAPAGANNEQQCRMIREYVLPLPKIETLIWVASPRAFNARRDDDRKMKEFFASPGYLHDQRHRAELWPVAGSQPVTIEQLRQIRIDWVDPWGWEGRAKTTLPPTVEEARPIFAKQMELWGSEFDDDAWEELAATAREAAAKGIRVFILTVPFHPFTKDSPAADPDHTSREVHRQLIARLDELDREVESLWFRDFNQGGGNGFAHDEFYDADHLNRKGSGRLTAMLIDWMAQCLQGPAGQRAAAR